MPAIDVVRLNQSMVFLLGHLLRISIMRGEAGDRRPNAAFDSTPGFLGALWVIIGNGPKTRHR